MTHRTLQLATDVDEFPSADRARGIECRWWILVWQTLSGIVLHVAYSPVG
ncbi:hypothetical protein [Novipirellula artificiosorum]|nr:hypothetical protein [Novipirellula artificiosorum]